MSRKKWQSRSRAERHRDRLKISDLYLKGYSQIKIADETGLSQATVSRDINVLIRYWKRIQLRNIDTRVEQELAKINKLEVEYWEAWERSKEERKTASQKTKLSLTEKNVKIEELIGDPRYLNGVQWCINKRCDLLGLDAAKKIDLGNKEGLPFKTETALDDFTLEEIGRRVRSLLVEGENHEK